MRKKRGPEELSNFPEAVQLGNGRAHRPRMNAGSLASDLLLLATTLFLVS